MTNYPENHDPLINDREAIAFRGIARPTFWKWVAAGTLPAPVKIGRLSRWPRSEIVGVIEEAKRARDARAA